MRLKQARIAAGFASAQDAATRFGWVYPTYSAHENGRRGMRHDALRIYARAFKADLLWLMEGTGDGPKGPAPVRTDRPPDDLTGFHEPAIVPFVGRRPGQERALMALAEELTPDLRHRQMFMATRTHAAYAVLAGDVLVIGTTAAPVDGDLVIATLALPGPEDAQTVLRQRAGSILVAPPGGALPDEGMRNAGILGTVAALIRPPRA